MSDKSKDIGDAELENAETLLKFPTPFPIKAMGRREDGFAQTVLEIILKHAPDFDASTLEMRPSKKGNFLSVTATINAQSKAQLDDIYRALTAHPAVLMALQPGACDMMQKVVVKQLGLADYEPTWRAMQSANKAHSSKSPDEIWVLEHPPVFTLGLAGKYEHVLAPGNIPVVKIDRGGQVTYHGPGQLVVYLLLDLKKLGYGVKELVKRIEQSVIDLLAEYRIAAYRLAGMPGVYVNLNDADAKIAAIGLRVANHATYHGLSLNIDMDLEPFSRINPCGYEGLAVTQVRNFGVTDKMAAISEKLVSHLQSNLLSQTSRG